MSLQALPTRSGTRASPNYGAVGRWEWSQPSRQPLKTPCKAFTGHVYDTCTSQWSWLVFDLRATSGSSAGLSYQRNARMARLERNASDRTGSDQDRIKIGSDRRSGALRLVGSDARFRLDYNSLFICGTDNHVCPPRRTTPPARHVDARGVPPCAKGNFGLASPDHVVFPSG